ncbi:MAG: helix-turn-helix transcriptional regulator [Flavobacteriaceae bacterium]|nr:helix-turn-helix transcriptional regulator [Flavobacteriaceae bacterium]
MKMTKQPILENISPEFGSSLNIHNYKEPKNEQAAKWHFHPEMEIVFVHGGAGKRHIGDHISYYNDGDLIFIGSNVPHMGFTDRLTNNKSEVVIHIKEDFLGPGFFDLPEMASIKRLFERSKQGIVFHSRTKWDIGIRIEALLHLSPFERVLEFLKILDALSHSQEYTLLHVDEVIIESKPQDTQRLDLIYKLVRNEFTRSISLGEAAELVSMSEQAFSRYFKNKTGKTFTQFVNEYRLVHASKLLSEEHLSITNICYESGFNNFSHFNKQFKKYTGKSPSQYRNELRTVLK